MKRKKGFTLSEALITTAIVGLVAMLTIPTMVINYRKQIYAKTLAVAVADFQNAFNMMMLKDDVDRLRDTKVFQTLYVAENSNNKLKRGKTSDAVIRKFMAEFSKYIEIDDYVGPGSYDVLNPFKNEVWQSPGAIRFISPKGLAYEMLYEFSELTLYIDINGDKGPNIVGRDYFAFKVDQDGKVNSYDTDEDDIKSCPKELTGRSCSGYLMRNGYKMDY